MVKKNNEAIEKEAPAGALANADFGEFAGSGYEGTTSDDLKRPFIRVLQTNSPEIEEGTVEGAKPGMLLNTASNDLVPHGERLLFIPIAKKHHFVEWRPREAGGGFVDSHAVDSAVVKQAIADNGGKKFGKLSRPATDEKGNVIGQNEIIETHDVFALLLDETGKVPRGDNPLMACAVISFTSTKIKPLTAWFTKLYTLRVDSKRGKISPPIWANRCAMETVKDQNAKGKFFNVKVGPMVEGSYADSLVLPGVEDDLFVTAKELYKQYNAGEVGADYESQTQRADADSGGEDKVPF